MSYSDIDMLTQDPLFGGRIRACCVEQAEVYKNDARPEFVDLANDVLKGDGQGVASFIRITAAAPGIAEMATTNGSLDQSQVTDGAILASVQANWEVVADLFYSTPA